MTWSVLTSWDSGEADVRQNVCKSLAQDQPHRLLADLPAPNGSPGERPHLVQRLPGYPAFGHAQQHLHLPQAVPDLCHDAHGGVIPGEGCLHSQGEGAVRLGQACSPSLRTPGTSPPGHRGSGGCRQSRAGRAPVVAGPRAAEQSS